MRWSGARVLVGFGLAIVIAAIFVVRVLGFAGQATVSQSTVAKTVSLSGSPDPHILQIFQTSALPGNQSLPPVVARVGQSDITAAAFARQVAIVTDNSNNQQLGWTQGQIWRNALNGLIQDAALYERAKTEGIFVSDSELASLITDQRAALAQSEQADPSVIARVEAAITAAGDADYESFVRDPKILNSYRRDLMKGKLLSAHLGKNSTPQTIDLFIKQTVAQANAQVFIVPPA